MQVEVEPAGPAVVDRLAAQLPTSLALLLATVPAERRTAATRGWAAVGGLAAAAGPVLGGLLVEIDWRWVFVVNLPIGVLTLVAGLAVLPARRPARPGRCRIRGARR